MATEIELKAHIKDSEALRLLLVKKAEYQGIFEKEDAYWFDASGLPLSTSRFFRSGLRIRREKRSLPGGTVKETTFATYKNKEVRDGIEINDEREFEVNPGPVFEEFLRRMGLEPGISKRKKGWAFIKDGICVELVEVDGNGENRGFRGLGWFVELEILIDTIGDNRAEIVAEGRQRLLGFLFELGIEKEAIESRFYTELLNELPRDGAGPR